MHLGGAAVHGKRVTGMLGDRAEALVAGAGLRIAGTERDPHEDHRHAGAARGRDRRTDPCEHGPGIADPLDDPVLHVHHQQRACHVVLLAASRGAGKHSARHGP